MHFWSRVAVIFFLSLLYLPGVQMVLRIVPEVELQGVVVESTRPRLTPQAWLSGAFQDQLSQWFEDRLGFRGHLIKTENQLNFSLFHDISAQTKTKIILGKDRYLYEYAYVHNWNGQDILPGAVYVKALEERVRNFKELQEALRKRGITLVLLLSPSKASVYPEFIPTAYHSPLRTQRNTYYARLRPLLDAAGVEYLDAREYFLTHKATSSYPFFTRGGTHWNYYGACLIARELILRLETLQQKDMANLHCEPVIVDNTTYGTDRDLAHLVNIWDDAAFDGPTPHPTITTSGGEKVFKPKILWVGDSFTWTLLSIMDSRGIYQSRNFFYYYNRNSSFPEGKEVALDQAAIDWEKDVFSHNIIIIEASETAIPEFGFGFVEDAFKAISTPGSS